MWVSKQIAAALINKDFSSLNNYLQTQAKLSLYANPGCYILTAKAPEVRICELTRICETCVEIQKV